VLFAGAAVVVGPTSLLPAVLYFLAIAVALALIDLDVHRLPDAIVLPSYPVALGLLALASWNPGGEPSWDAKVRAVIGAVVLFVVYLVLAVVYPSGMGFGDVKLAGVLGLYLGFVGWGALLVGAFAAFFLGGIFSLVLLALKRVGRKSGIPFGPWMLIGAWVGIFAGNTLFASYLSLFGLA
jgi:leader peptidase (prepilin peptidase)/N-methyltransferase